MEDFNALAAALGAGIRDVRGCLIVSRDGLVLGAHPVGMEAEAKHAWNRFASLGEPERGFVQFGTEVWCYVRRGPYAAFALTGTGVRPGLVIDHMDEVLLLAEESRTRRSGVRIGPADAATAAPSRLRVPLHPDPRPVDDAPIVRAEPPPPRPVPVSAPGTVVHAETPERPRDAGGFGSEQPRPAPDPEPHPAAAPETATTEPGPDTGSEPDPPPASTSGAELDAAPPSGTERHPEPPVDPEDGAPAPAVPDDDVDRFSLAREFSQLLQEQRTESDG